MKNYHLLALALVSCLGMSCSNHQSKNTEKSAKDSLYLKESWSADSVLTPESVLWVPKGQFFYVSEIGAQAGEGAIGKMDTKGKVLSAGWAKGLHAPKGMGVYKDTLFVADLKELVLINTTNGEVIRKIQVPDAVFLNDVAVGGDGTVYISDTRQGKIYTYRQGKTVVFLQKPETKDANGLLVKGDTLWMLTATGIYTYNLTDQTIHLFSDGVKGGDGITFINDSSLIASRWAGEVFYVNHKGEARLILDTQKTGKNTADLHYVPELKLLVIPTFKGQTVQAYQLKYK